MEELNKKILGLRELMKDMKTEMYAIVNPDLVALDEYTKNLYLKMLCTVVQYENEPSEMQVLYLKRIVKGIGVEEPLEEHMRKALAISEVDINEFLSFMRENLARYYFALESMLLLAMGNTSQNSYEYTAEIVELCRITRGELDGLSLVAKSVLQQEPSYYDEAREMLEGDIVTSNFVPYIKDYYYGAIVENFYEIYYSAPLSMPNPATRIKSNYDEKKVTFCNIQINVDEEIEFSGCKQLTFSNCIIYGANYRFMIRNVGEVIFDNCKFFDFGNKVAECFCVNRFIVKNCSFKNCYFSSEDGDKRGGIYSVHDADYQGMEQIVLENNELHNCYIEMRRHRYNYGVSGVFIECPSGTINEMIVKGNRFTGCQCIGNGNYTTALIGRFSANSIVEEDNIATGELTRLFEN